MKKLPFLAVVSRCQSVRVEVGLPAVGVAAAPLVWPALACAPVPHRITAPRVSGAGATPLLVEVSRTAPNTSRMPHIMP